MAGAMSDSNASSEERSTPSEPEHFSFTLDFTLLFVVTLVLALLVGGITL